MKVVALFSVKGGVGKTTAAVNLAWLAAGSPQRASADAPENKDASRSGKSRRKTNPPCVLVWDLDPQGAATYLLGAKPKVRGGTESLISGKRSIADAIRRSAFPGIDVLPADESSRDIDILLEDAKSSRRRIEKALAPVAKNYDVVILDCPPGSSLLAHNAVRAADVVVVPVVPSPLVLRSLDQVADVVADVPKPPRVLAFLTMVDRRKKGHRLAVEELAAQRPEVVDVVVPAAAVVEHMGEERGPVGSFAPRSAAAAAYATLWQAVDLA